MEKREGMCAQLCPSLFNSVDCSPWGSSVHGISQQGYWSGLLFPSPGDLPDPGIKLTSPVSPALVVRIFTTEPQGSPWKVNTSPGSTQMLLRALRGALVLD